MLTRLRRVVRHRLVPLVVVVALGAGGAIAFTNASNEGIRPTFQAVAVASLANTETEPESGRNNSGPSVDLVAAQDAAIEANADFIDVNHVVTAAPSIESIEFTVIGMSPEEATTEAADMRDRYLVATAPEPVEARMEEVLAKAHVVREQLNALLPPEEEIPSDPLVAAQKALLNGQISTLTSESAQLSVALVLADTEGEKAAIQADIDTILVQLVALRTQLAALPADSTEDSGSRGPTTGAAGDDGRESTAVGESNAAVDDLFQIESLQSLYASLQVEFQMLYIESTNGGPAQIPEIEVTDLTSDPIPLPLAGATGLVGFLLLGLGAVLVDDRLRPKWWTQGDLKGVLAETPDRRVRDVEPWYWNTPTGPRKLAIQKVAVSLLPSVEAGPVAVGVVGLATKPTALRTFSVDLAATMVTTGRSSLVIDTTGLEEAVEAEPWEVAGGPVVADLLNPWKHDIDDSQISRAVAEAGELFPGLSVIPSGGPSLYSIEGAMTPVVSKLLDYARKTFEITLVPITERGTALSDALVRNLDAVVIVGRGGKTSIRDAASLAERLTANGRDVLGSVLVLKPSRRKFTDLLRDFRRKNVRPAQAVTPAPAVTPRARTTARHVAFNSHGITDVLDKYSISDSWESSDEGENQIVEAIAVNENNGESMADRSNNDGSRRRPRLTAVLASHPDARRRSDG